MKERTHKEKIALAKEWAEYLNSLIEIDPDFMQTFIDTRHACNEGMYAHPMVQAASGQLVGALGILNGFIGVIPSGKFEGWGYLCGEFHEVTGRLLKLSVFKGALEFVP
jgi:hypothetical protein